MKFEEMIPESFHQFLNEAISSSEAARDEESIKTVIDGRRNAAFLVLTTQRMIDPRDSIRALSLAISAGLNLLPIKNRQEGVAFVVWNRDRRSAEELAQIANEKKGYLEDTTSEEARRIGELLGYRPQDIDEYINRKYSK